MLTSSSLYALNMILTVVVHMYDPWLSIVFKPVNLVCVCASAYECVRVCVCVLLLLQDKKLRLLEDIFSFSLGTQP